MQPTGGASRGHRTLSASGVDTVKELKTRSAANLADKMREVNGRKKLARTSPSQKSIEKWVAQAKQMLAVLRY